MTIRWGYAIDQWKPQFDDFVRRRDIERAFKTISIAGFSGVQLKTGSGRWEPYGNPEQVAANWGSVEGLGDHLRECALDGLVGWAWDPGQGFSEDLSRGVDVRDPAQRDELIRKALWLAEATAEAGGDVLVVQPAAAGGSALDDDAIGQIAESWNAVGRATQRVGVRTALRFDFLSSLRVADGWDRLLARLDGQAVGTAVDTGHFAAAGLDPLAQLVRDEVPLAHVVLSNALARDDDDEFARPGAAHTLRSTGGARRIPRWFGELDDPQGLVDSEAVVRRLAETRYDGWVVVDTAPSPHPATSALLSGYHLQRVLVPASSASEGVSA